MAFDSSLLLFFLLWLPNIVLAQTYSNISLGTSLTPLNLTYNWPSPSGDFAFGFRPLETNSSLFLLAVFYNRIPDKTIVWTPNGGKPVTNQSKAELTYDGQLSLKDSAGQEIWNPGVDTATFASMLDTGNFALSSRDSRIIWQTFDAPTDTILPTQVLKQRSVLNAKLKYGDYSKGMFQLALQDDGDLVMNDVASPSNFTDYPYYSAGTSGTGARQLVFDKTGSIYLLSANNTRIPVLPAPDGAGDKYVRATLDKDGVFRQYSFLKSSLRTGSWRVEGRKGSDTCQYRSTIGSASCGLNSCCTLDARGEPICNCPDHYSFIDPSRKYMGCKPDFSPQSCEPGSEVSFQLMTVADIYWPLDGSVYEEHSYVNDKFCMDNCLEDCSCSAAIYSEAINGGTCWKKKLPLSNGRRNKDVASRTAFIKFSPLNGSTSAPPILGAPPAKPPAPPTKPYKSRIKVVAIIVSLVFGILLLSCVFCFLWKRKRRLGKILQQQQSTYLSFLVFGILLLSRICWCLRKRKKRRQGVKDRSNEMDGENSLDLPLVDFHTIVSATNNFSAENKLGEGGFGPVYKGKLGEDQEVAVKRLCKTSQQGVDEFRNEVILIAKLQHRNLVRLLGCCIHGEERMLVYEYMPNKSLDAFLFGKDECTFLSWRTRYQIIIGIARGLLYLHQDSRLRIIHRDLKASNILLDKDMIPKISDFGMARIFEGDESDFNTRKVVGTYGYMSPEYALEGTFSMKSDIFSFGVLVLEIISGQKNRGLYAFSPHLNLLAHAWSLWSEGDILQLAQEGMSSVPTNEVLKCIKIGLLCVQERPEDRPLMSNVIEMFSSDISSLPQPNPPGFISRFGPTEIDRQEPCSLNGVSISELSGR